MSHRIVALLLALSLVLSSAGLTHAKPAAAPAAAPEPAFSSVMFIENVGQFAEGARFRVWGGPAGTMWLADDAIWLTVVEPRSEEAAPSSGDPKMRIDLPLADAEGKGAPRNAINIKLSFVGANPHPRIEPFDRLDTVVSYFIGNEPDKWRPNVPVWGGVRYVDLYPGVNLEITSEDGQAVQRLAVRPGADLDAVQLRVEGADAVAVDGGVLRLSTTAGEIGLPLLRADGMRLAGLKVQPRGAQAFDVAAPFARTRSNPQSSIADPLSFADNPADLLYGTFLGGSNEDEGNAIAVDGTGSAYVTGVTLSPNFPTTPGAFDRAYKNGFVVKLNSTASELVYATFLDAWGQDIVVDREGKAYVTGRAWGSGFPATSGAFDTSFNGYSDAFVVKLNPIGSALEYATFLGGSGEDYGSAIVVDGGGSAYIMGGTVSIDFPATPIAFDPSHNGGSDAFVVKLNPRGSALEYATFLGGADEDGNDYIGRGGGITVDGTGSIYVTGLTRSNNFPTTSGAFDTTYSGGQDAFVVKLNPAGSGLTYATFLGGSSDDYGYAIAIDGAGNGYMAGSTSSANFPTATGAFDTSHNGYDDAFVVKLNPAGSGLVYATFLGGSSSDSGYAIAVDAGGSAYVTGQTYSEGSFPTTSGAFDTSCHWLDAYAARLDPAGSRLIYSTCLGGSDHDRGNGIALDGLGRAYVTGQTCSYGFPTTSGAFDRSFNGNTCQTLFSPYDSFVVKLSMGPPPPLDAAALASQSDYLTVAPGAAISPWVEVRNTGTTTWTPAEYGWNGKGALAGTTGYMPRNVAPGETQRFFWNLTASTMPGTYDYGFMLRHGTQEFGPYFFVRVTVVTYTISGRVTYLSGAGMAGVAVSAGSYSATTNTNGDYTLTGLPTGTYTVTPSRPAYAFSPSTRSVNLPAGTPSQNATGIDFVGRAPSISHLEATQATQTTSNSVPLIAGKTTVLRAYLDCGEGCSRVTGVTGILRGFGTAGELSGSPLHPVNAAPIDVYHEDWASQRPSLAKTLNFMLPNDWLDGLVIVTVEVEGSRASETLEFDKVEPLTVLYLPIRYQGTYADEERILKHANWARQVYPISKLNYVQGATLEWNSCLERDFLQCPLGTINRYNLLNELTTRGRLVNAYVFGWLPQETFDGGQSDISSGGGTGNGSFGDDHPTEGPRIFAHEIAHLLGRKHVKLADSCGSATDPSSDWPFSNSSIQDYGLDTYGFGRLRSTAAAVKPPATTFDYMSYCGSLAEGTVWTSPWTYERLYNRLKSPANLEVNAASVPQQYFLISGLVYTDQRVSLDPVWVISSATTPDSVPNGSTYCLEVLSAGGGPLVSRCFDLSFIDYETGHPVEVQGFNAMLPSPSGANRIILRKGSTILVSRLVSANSPVVDLISPNGGETWDASGSHVIRWTAYDVDGDSLTYRVLYSPNDKDWVPVGTAVTMTQVIVNSAELAGGTTARVRVLASDGVNVSTAESSTTFTVGRKGPRVFILSPESNTQVASGTLFWLQGQGYDLEDGILEGLALKWHSDQDGDLGTGEQKLVTLSPGLHDITLTATDSDNMSTEARIRVFVGAKAYLPLVLKSSGGTPPPTATVSPTPTATPTPTWTPTQTPTASSTPVLSCGGPGIDSWQTTSALPQALAAPFDGTGRPLVIHQGRAYIFGGKSSTDERVTTVYTSAIQPTGALGAWTAATSLPGQYYDHIELVIGDYVYLVSGANGATAVWRSAFSADGALGSWSKIADLPASRQSFAAVAYGTNIYITGGNSSGTLATVLMGAVRSDGITWQTLPPLPQPTQSHAMLAYNGQLYVLTTSKTVYRASIYSDGSIGAWTTTTSLPLAMQRFSAVECNGYLYALSDTAGEVYWAPVSADGGLGPWIKTISLPQSRASLRIGISGCFIYAAGGHDGANFRDTVYYTRLQPPALSNGASD